jgi:hypothetical protein
MAQTKADRSAAGKKAAATRKRNEQKTSSKQAGKKAASTRKATTAKASAKDAKQSGRSAVTNVTDAAKSAGGAAVGIGKSLADRVGAARKKK